MHATADPIELGLPLKLLQALDFDRQKLLQVLAAVGGSQTRRRLSEGKTAPDGTRWPDWSASYAASRGGGQSLLQDSRALTGSIRGFVDGSVAVWGSDLVYAGIHNAGGTTKPHVITAKPGKALKVPGVGYRKSVNHPGSVMPQRQLIGLSEANAEDMEAEVDLFLSDLLQF